MQPPTGKKSNLQAQAKPTQMQTKEAAPISSPPAFVTPMDPKDAQQTAQSLSSSNVLWANFLKLFLEGMPQLTVGEVVRPVGDVGHFNLQIDGVSDVENVGSGGTTGAQTLTFGSHTVTETAGSGTSLSGYKVVTGGDCASSGSIALTLGDRKNCVITSIGQPPHCRSGLTACSNACVDLQNDSQNCGKCGTVCTKGNSCSGGSCSKPACPTGFLTCCGGDICSKKQCPPTCP